jgi:sulfhydrogenase subunit beta (sulfur reductase)
MAKIIPEKEISSLAKSLAKMGIVYAPISKDGEILFDAVNDSSNLALTYTQTPLPPKMYFLPANEELFKVTDEIVQEPSIPTPFIIFGLNLKDLAAVNYLDKIMKKEPADIFYLKRRNAATLIAITENTVGSHNGSDLTLEKRNGSYLAHSFTEKGNKILKSNLFKEASIPEKSIQEPQSSHFDELLLDSGLLAQAVEWSRENSSGTWEALGKICLSCGICTYVCPLCFCTSTEDKTSLDGSECTRCRKWDACTLPRFAQIAGGHNFRPDQKSRYYNWFYHKFVRGYKEFGQAQCVACGRCQKYCPAGIDIEKILTKLVDDYKSVHTKKT